MSSRGGERPTRWTATPSGGGTPPGGELRLFLTRAPVDCRQNASVRASAQEQEERVPVDIDTLHIAFLLLRKSLPGTT